MPKINNPIWLRLAVLVGAAAVYLATLGSPFHFDDYSLLSDPAVVEPLGFAELARPERTRPLTYLTFWLNYQIDGAEPWGYHLFNLAAFLGCVWLAGSVFERVAPGRAAAAALIVFAFHPLQSEAVAYVFARATLLAALFSLASWRAWIGRRWALSALLFAAALAAKEEAATLPLFLAGYELTFRDGFAAHRRAKAIALAAMAALVALAAARLIYAARVIEGAGALFDLDKITPVSYFLAQGRVVWLYLRLLVWPAGQNFDWDIPLTTAPGWWPALALLVGAAAWAARRRRGFYWVVGGLLLLAPTSTFAPLADLAAERRMFLPMMSFALAVGTAWAWTFKRVSGRAYLALSVAAALGLSGLTWRRCLVWRSEEALWSDVVAKSPRKVRPKLQLARALAPHGGEAFGRRKSLLDEARRLDPNNVDAVVESGVFHLQTGDPAAALGAFEHALSLNPDDAQTIANIGSAMLLTSRGEEARAAYRRALRLDPCNFDARNNLMLALRGEGRNGEARELARRTPPDCLFTPEQRRALGR